MTSPITHASIFRLPQIVSSLSDVQKRIEENATKSQELLELFKLGGNCGTVHWWRPSFLMFVEPCRSLWKLSITLWLSVVFWFRTQNLRTSSPSSGPPESGRRRWKLSGRHIPWEWRHLHRRICRELMGGNKLRSRAGVSQTWHRQVCAASWPLDAAVPELPWIFLEHVADLVVRQIGTLGRGSWDFGVTSVSPELCPILSNLISIKGCHSEPTNTMQASKKRKYF